MAIPEPPHPDPAEFGLTKERLAEFENAYPWFATRLLGIVFVVTLLCLGAGFFSGKGGVGAIRLGQVAPLIMIAFMGIAVSFATAFMVAFPGAMIVASVWKWMQSDYSRVTEYERAVSQYKFEHAEWLKTQRSWWDRLHPQRFEHEIASFFKKQGHRVEWTGRSGDGGIDIKVMTDEGRRIIVQCKAHEKPVSPGAVRDLYGTLLHEKADEAWLMSRSGFTLGAAKFAEGKPIRLLNLDHVLPGLGANFDPHTRSRRR